MKGFSFLSGYRDMDKYRLSFNALAKLTFGIDLETWYQAGGWNDRYVCYSYLDGERVIANVSASRLDMVVKGAEYRVVQIGTVMTHPDYRGRGLARSLMDIVLKETEGECDLVYLFADESARGLYQKCGFTERDDYQVSCRVRNPGPGISFQKLDMNKQEDLETVRRIITDRVPVSLSFHTKNDSHITFWHCLNDMRDCLYLADPDTVIAYRKKGSEGHLYDVISTKPFSVPDVLSRVRNDEVTSLIRYFPPDPDTEDLPEDTLSYQPRNDGLFIKPVPPWLPDRIVYPATAIA